MTQTWLELLFKIALFVAAFFLGTQHSDSKWQLREKDLQAKIVELETRADKVTVEVVTKYVDRIKVVKEKGDEIIKEIPVYVTAADDNRCTINNGWVWLHNAASKGEGVSATTSGTNDQTSTIAADQATQDSGVKLSEAMEVISRNYEAHHATVQQLESLQEWIRKQQEVK